MMRVQPRVARLGDSANVSPMYDEAHRVCRRHTLWCNEGRPGAEVAVAARTPRIVAKEFRHAQSLSKNGARAFPLMQVSGNVDPDVLYYIP
jgi:hypothetical protein